MHYQRIIRRLDGLERITQNLVRYGASIRADVRRHDGLIAKIEAVQARTEMNLAEATDKLNALIGHSDNTDKRLNTLIRAQDNTERKLQGLLDGLRKKR